MRGGCEEPADEHRHAVGVHKREGWHQLSSADNFLYVVTNAGTREKDMAAMSKKLQEMKAKGKDVTLRFADERGLLAVQGEFFTKLKRLIVCVNSFFYISCTVFMSL